VPTLDDPEEPEEHEDDDHHEDHVQQCDTPPLLTGCPVAG